LLLAQQRGAMFVSWAFVRPNEQKTSCVNKLLFYQLYSFIKIKPQSVKKLPILCMKM